jgi:transcriptional regulator with XRE-family HTH domain
MEESLRLSRNKLRQMRELRGWTQKDLAEKLSLPDTRTLRRWESGGAAPSLRYRARLCDIFGMGPEELGLISESQQPMTVRKTPASSLHYFPDSVLPASSSGLQLPVPLDLSPLSPQRWYRQRLLEKVYAFWIKGVLE